MVEEALREAAGDRLRHIVLEGPNAIPLFHGLPRAVAYQIAQDGFDTRCTNEG